MKITVYMLLLLGLCFSCNNAEKLDKEAQTYLDKSMERGEIVYNTSCLKCHGADGIGTEAHYPPLALSDWLTDKRVPTMQAIRKGLRGPITVNNIGYNSIMIPVKLSNEELADVLNYIMNSWGNKQEKIVTPEEVAAMPSKRVPF